MRKKLYKQHTARISNQTVYGYEYDVKRSWSWAAATCTKETSGDGGFLFTCELSHVSVCDLGDTKCE